MSDNQKSNVTLKQLEAHLEAGGEVHYPFPGGIMKYRIPSQGVLEFKMPAGTWIPSTRHVGALLDHADLTLVAVPWRQTPTSVEPEKGKKFDSAKVRLDLVPVGPLLAVAAVQTYGAKKYGDNNWQFLENAEDRYYAALLRHLFAWREGATRDPETGLLHLAHAACNALFLLWFALKGEKQ